MNYYIAVLKNYATFNGRARRKEYWFFALFNGIAMIVLSILDGIIGTEGIIAAVYILAVLIPGIAVAFRRLHDTDRTGWWILIILIPLIGPLVFLYFMVSGGDAGANRFGEDPIQDNDENEPEAEAS